MNRLSHYARVFVLAAAVGMGLRLVGTAAAVFCYADVVELREHRLDTLTSTNATPDEIVYEQKRWDSPARLVGNDLEDGSLSLEAYDEERVVLWPVD